MISFRALSTVSLLGLLVTLAGCSAESATSGASTTDSVKQESAVADGTPNVKHHGGPMMHGPHGGPDFLLFAALHEPAVNLTDAQRATIQGAIEANRPSGEVGIDTTKTKALAAGIRAGKVDATVMAPPDMSARQAASAKALTTLHDTLSADQRKALVDAVSKHAENGPKHGPGGPGGPEGRPEGHGPKGGMGPMGHLLEGLDLTQAQQDSIKAKLDANRPAPPSDADVAQMKANHEAMKAQMQTKLASFTADSFDANAFVAPPAGAKPPQHADHFAQELSIITSVLEPAQREKLAQKIEAGPQMHMKQAPRVQQQ